MKTMAICSSVSFYEQVITAKNVLADLGFTVFVPDLAEQMERENNYRFLSYAEQFDDKNPLLKKSLIDTHFKKIAKSNGILIINNTKHQVGGYIGPNVLMELTVGYYLGKKIFLLNSLSKRLACYDEVMALQPIVLHGDMAKIKDFDEQ